MKLELPPETVRAVVEPLLKGVAAELAAELLRIAADMSKSGNDGYMDKEGVARYLGQSVRAIERWMHPVREEGGRGLPHIKVGETVIFSKTRIDEWALRLEKNPLPLQFPGRVAA